MSNARRATVDPILDALERAPRGELTEEELKALASARAETSAAPKSHEAIMATLNARRK